MLPGSPRGWNCSFGGHPRLDEKVFRGEAEGLARAKKGREEAGNSEWGQRIKC